MMMNMNVTNTPTRMAPDVWQEYRLGLYRFVLKRVHDEAAADDIVQDALAKILANFDSLRDQQKIRQWMYQITRNAIVDYFRRHRMDDALPDELLVVDEPDGSSVEEELSACCISPFIKKLPEKYRTAITLSEIKGLTQKEVANREGMSLSGAKSRVQRGRKMLKEMMLACCQFDVDSQGRIIDYQASKGCRACAKAT